MGRFDEHEPDELRRRLEEIAREADARTSEYLKKFFLFLDVAKAIYMAAFSCEKEIRYPKNTPYLSAIRMKVFFEILFFFLHMADRMALSALGDSGRGKLLKAVIPTVLTLSVDHWLDIPVDRKKEFRASLYDDFINNITVYYESATELASRENPIAGNSLVSKLARSIAEQMHREENSDTILQAGIALMLKLPQTLPDLKQRVEATAAVIDEFQLMSFDPWNDPGYRPRA